LASNARRCYNAAYQVSEKGIIANPDEILLNWLNAEFDLFKTFENDRYSARIKTPFLSVEELINFANTILNRRKSRAGKSLEHHLSEIFSKVDLKFEEQVVTEENKRPDFIFPGAMSYHDNGFDASGLIFLAAKTTCKDRWRQVLNEADRIPEKHLFTLQQGISTNQLAEMYKYNVRLIVPKPYLSCFPENFRERILTLDRFVNLVKSKQN
jgi:type II restriction enzyme